MAINPMQRKARNSFLGGFFIALIIGAGISYFFYTQMSKAKQEYNSLVALQKNVYVAMEDIKSGTEVTLDDFKSDKVQTSLDNEDVINADVFEYIDDKTGEIVEKYDSDGNKMIKKMVVKTDIPAGSIITSDMLEEIDDRTTADQRIQEYNMLILPTQLEDGDYIDIRLQLPEGEDFIVVSKKKVLSSTADTVWLKMREDEILSLGNAIVEAYTMTGSKLYATIYSEPGRQEAAEPTYAVSEKIFNLIDRDPNIIDKAKRELNDRYNGDNRNAVNDVVNQYSENRNDLVETGVQEEITKLQTSRQQYVESLQGGTTITE